MSFFGPPNITQLYEKKDEVGLVKSLQYRKDPNIRIAAATALGNLKVAIAVEPLVIAIQEDQNLDVKRAAAISLGKIGDSRALEPLLSAYSKGDLSDDRAVVEALEHIGDVRAIKIMLPQYENILRFPNHHPDNTVVMNRTMKTLLERYREEAIPMLINCWKEEHKSLYGDIACRLLVEIGSPSVLPLIYSLGKKDKLVRKYAAEALGEIGDKRAVEPLIGVLEKCKDGCFGRSEVIKALGKLRDVRAVKILIPILSENNLDIKCAVEALGNICDSSAVDALIGALVNHLEDTTILRYISDSLGKIGDTRAVMPLIDILTKPKKVDELLIGAVADALGELRDVRAVKPLINALRYDKESIAGDQITEALGKIGASAVEPLILALEDADHNIRGFGSAALGVIGDKRAVEPLIIAMINEDKDSNWVIMNIANALVNIGDTRAIGPLLYMLKFDEGLETNTIGILEDSLTSLGYKHKNKQNYIFKLPNAKRLIRQHDIEGLLSALRYRTLRYEITKLLCEITDKRAVEPLITMLKDRDNKVCLNAVIALGKIKDPRAIDPLISSLCNPFLINKAAESLEKMRWKPSYDINGALYLIGNMMSDKSVKIGVKYIDPLISLLVECEDYCLLEPYKKHSILVRSTVLNALYKNGKPAFDKLYPLLKKTFIDVRKYVAGNIDTPPKLLNALSDDNSLEVQALVAQNPNTSAAIMKLLSINRSYTVSAEVGSIQIRALYKDWDDRAYLGYIFPRSWYEIILNIDMALEKLKIIGADSFLKRYKSQKCDKLHLVNIHGENDDYYLSLTAYINREPILMLEFDNNLEDFFQEYINFVKSSNKLSTVNIFYDRDVFKMPSKTSFNEKKGILTITPI